MADESVKVTFDEAQQKLVDKLVGEARVKAKAIATAEHEAAQTKAKEESDQAALVAEKKWQELAEKHEARVKELEPFEAQGKAYSELIAGMLKDRVKELGDAAKKFMATLSKDMPPAEKLALLNANQALFGSKTAGVGTPGGGRPPTKKKAADAGHVRKRL